MDLSDRVKELRAKKGFSQEYLAEISGLSLRTIQRVENGETVPRGDTIQRLAAILPLSPDEITNPHIVEDQNMLTLLNVSQLGFLLFPVLGILIPWVIWISTKDAIKGIDALGKAVLNFQISWVILLFSLYAFLLAGFVFHIRIHISWQGLLGIIAFTGILYFYNLLLIITNTLRNRNKKPVYYKPAFVFIK